MITIAGKGSVGGQAVICQATLEPGVLAAVSLNWACVSLSTFKACGTSVSPTQDGQYSSGCVGWSVQAGAKARLFASESFSNFKVSSLS